MRLLMTADAVGGVWTYALELAGALAPFGIETTLATMGPPPTADQIVDALDVPGLDLVTSSFALEWMDDPWRDVRGAGDWLLEVAADVQPAIVHLNGFAHGALPFHAPVIVAGHSCVASWASATGGSIDPAWMRSYREAATTGLRAASWVVAPSAGMLDALQQTYGPLQRASIVPNGRSAAMFTARRRTDKDALVFSAGRLWDRAKNVEALVRIAGALPWPVYVAGDGAVDASAPVHALGRLSSCEIAEWLSRAAIFALPARYEPFGLLPLEAALSRCALVLGDIATLREIWGDAAVYVDPDRPEALESAIALLIARPDLRDAYASAAHERANSYTPSRMARMYERIYESAARAQARAERRAS